MRKNFKEIFHAFFLYKKGWWWDLNPGPLSLLHWSHAISTTVLIVNIQTQKFYISKFNFKAYSFNWILTKTCFKIFLYIKSYKFRWTTVGSIETFRHQTNKLLCSFLFIFFQFLSLRSCRYRLLLKNVLSQKL